MKRHLTHLAMCAPMLVIVAVLLIGGAGAASLLPFIACVGMMWAMMTLMPGHRHGHEDHSPVEDSRDASCCRGSNRETQPPR